MPSIQAKASVVYDLAVVSWGDAPSFNISGLQPENSLRNDKSLKGLYKIAWGIAPRE